MPNINDIVRNEMASEKDSSINKRLEAHIQNIIESKEVCGRISNMLTSASLTLYPELLLVALTGQPEYFYPVLKTVGAFLFEAGRLYGRSELIEELQLSSDKGEAL